MENQYILLLTAGKCKHKYRGGKRPADAKRGPSLSLIPNEGTEIKASITFSLRVFMCVT